MDPFIARKIDKEFIKYPVRKYPKGQILLFAGDTPACLFYVTEGKVRKYDISSRGYELAVNISKPPITTPLTSVLTNTPSRYFYKTETAVSLHAVPAEEALIFFKAHSDVLFGLLHWSYQSIDGLQGRIVQLMSGNAKNRVVYELINECIRFGQKNTNESYQLNVSETDLAARSGLSRETVSREINKLKSANLVAINGRRLSVPSLSDIEKLL
jgi:CRP/FNR family transcriptional regulator, cyclic AMP receptor protein